MFRGINPLTLDAKGRLAIPTKYRARLQSESGGQLVEQAQDVEVGGRLDCVVDVGAERRKGTLDLTVGRADEVGGVDEGGSADGVGDL